jgi:sortase A
VVSLPVLARGAALAVLATGSLLLASGTWMTVKADIAQRLLAHAWARAIDGETAPTPWPWADTWPVARLSVPILGENAIILAEAGGEALAFGPALLNASTPPGTPGVTVIAAHRDTHFRFLERVRAGHVIVLEQPAGPPVAYRVTGTEIVEASRSGIEPETGPDRLALVTCWPFGAVTPGPLRYVVWAERVTPV